MSRGLEYPSSQTPTPNHIPRARENGKLDAGWFESGVEEVAAPAESTEVSGAPLGASYLLRTSHPDLPNAQALALLGTGLLKNTETTGLLSLAVEGTDYYGPGGTDVAVEDGGTGASNAVDARTNLGAQEQDATLTALAAYNTNGLLVQTAADTFAGRTITGTANQVNVANGDGVAGNPTLSLPQNIHTGASPTFGGLSIADGGSIVAGSSGGLQVGTAATQKIGFWGASPALQPMGIVDCDGTLGDVSTKFNVLLGHLENIGILAVA